MHFVDLNTVMPEIEAKARELVDQADEASAECHPLRMMVIAEALCLSLKRQIEAEGIGAGNATVIAIARLLNACMARYWDEVERSPQ